ncbi:MAG TPA: GNAT family N-acetyltransferase [Thermoanaerobaculia bacterium]|nr:GNAT family N-acetyltransferase [Thermoanaerobaculia bacterium]
MDLLDLTPALCESIARNAPRELLPVHHPVWIDVLTALGEDARGIAAMEDDQVLGWLLYTVTRRGDVTVVNSLPYLAYGGPHADDEGVAEALLLHLRKIAQQLGADVLSIGTSPLLSAEQERAYVTSIEPTHVFENAVQLQSLATHPLAQLTKKRRNAIESEIHRGERARLIAVDHLDVAQFDEWLSIYRARYAEIGASPYPYEFHRQLHRRAVPAGIAEVRGVVDRDTGRLLGGIAFLVSPREATYFSSAFASDVRHLYPTTFLLNEAFHAFRARGIETFNWHSSPTQGGVHAYKRRWGARSHRHFYLSALLRSDTRLFEHSPDEVRRLFPLRFVLPFGAWQA